MCGHSFTLPSLPRNPRQTSQCPLQPARPHPLQLSHGTPFSTGRAKRANPACAAPSMPAQAAPALLPHRRNPPHFQNETRQFAYGNSPQKSADRKRSSRPAWGEMDETEILQEEWLVMSHGLLDTLFPGRNTQALPDAIDGDAALESRADAEVDRSFEYALDALPGQRNVLRPRVDLALPQPRLAPDPAHAAKASSSARGPDGGQIDPHFSQISAEHRPHSRSRPESGRASSALQGDYRAGSGETRPECRAYDRRRRAI